MSHKKVWKQFSYIKNDQSIDSQSSLSESRSAQSYRFNQVKFNKAKHYTQQSTKKFALANISRVKEFKGENSLLNDSNRRKQNSLIDSPHKQRPQPSQKTSAKKQIESKIKSYLLGIRKIHQDIRLIAQNLVFTFEKIKEQLEVNLINMSRQLLKFGNDKFHIQKVQDIFEKGFAQIRKNIIVLPASLTQMNSSFEEDMQLKDRNQKKELQSPLLRFEQTIPLSKSRTKVASTFYRKQVSEVISKKDFDLPLMSNQKLKQRPSTQRRQHLRTTSLEHHEADRILPTTHKLLRENDLKSKPALQPKEMTNIDNIILQMKIILNKSD